ncbi:hypothetical protein Clacol_003457 [Clathrus columnatus]|uniref:Glutathione S-transferase n=1 Tax=Clathrus columnatus TaxID=1419009 RepID=A0AAV5ABD2_9AGAM|nr:hypothetical protein Clacol_003457 [Clathrus columnatus]
MTDPQFTLYSSGVTPNPAKAAILLEELGLSYKAIHRGFGGGANGVKAADYLKINPNGRVPTIIDHGNNDKTVWESGAILFYLAEKYDTAGKYLGTNIDEKAEVMQWLIFQVSGMGPMQGQVHYFRNSHPVKNLDQSVYDRFINETHRVWNVFEQRLEGREWLALDRFTVAGGFSVRLLERYMCLLAQITIDIAVYTWLRVRSNGGLDLIKFPRLEAYLNRISEFATVKAAYDKLVAAKQVTVQT